MVAGTRRRRRDRAARRPPGAWSPAPGGVARDRAPMRAARSPRIPGGVAVTALRLALPRSLADGTRALLMAAATAFAGALILAAAHLATGGERLDGDAIA